MWDLHNKGICVRFCWMKAHLGIRGNEIVVHLAKQATVHDEVYNLGATYPHCDLLPLQIHPDCSVGNLA